MLEMTSPLALRALRAPLTLGLGLAACLAAGCTEEVMELPPVTYSGRFVDALDGAPLADVEICIVEPSGIPCVTTDATGAYTLPDLPAETRVRATAIKENYLSIHAAFVTRDTDLTLDAVMLQTALVAVAFTASGTPLEVEDQGAILVRTYDPAVGFTSALGGITGEISPSAGDGPIYNDEASIDPAATETSENSGTWFVVNLDPGTYQVRSAGTGRTCPGTFHWPGANGAGWLEAPVMAGFVTYLYVDCPAE